jgi:hypothetical protein
MAQIIMESREHYERAFHRGRLMAQSHLLMLEILPLLKSPDSKEWARYFKILSDALKTQSEIFQVRSFEDTVNKDFFVMIGKKQVSNERSETLDFHLQPEVTAHGK